MNTSDFGKTLLKLRKKLGFTQLELAKKLNVSDKTVSKWECGSGYPEITLLPTLSEIFGVPVDYLLKTNPKGITVAGNILVDVVNIIDKYPEKNRLANILETTNAVGGCVPNTIINLAKLDPDLFLTAIAKIGNDDHGRFVVSQMRKYGVDVSKIHLSDTSATGCSHVMTEKVSGCRTFFHQKGANAEFGISDIDVAALDCELFHIGYILLLDELDKEDSEYGTKMARLLHDIQMRGIKTSIDVVSAESALFAEKVIPALKYCNFAIMNEIECCMVTGLAPYKEDGSVHIENLRKTMEAFFDYGVKEKVIIHCQQAGFLMNTNREFLCVPSLVLPEGYIKGSVGAGDAFAAACLYGIYNQYSDRSILEFASCAAAQSLTASDSISGMKSKSEVEKLNTIFQRRENI